MHIPTAYNLQEGSGSSKCPRCGLAVDAMRAENSGAEILDEIAIAQ
jgi:hypothetical protein